MCGRCRCSIRPDDIPRACNIANRPVRFIDTDRYRPAYNVSPGSNIPVVVRDVGPDGQGVVVQCMKWGLIPIFTKETKKPDYYRMFNARSESIGGNAYFRRLLSRNRCLVAVEGFYEWKRDGSKMQPYYIHLKDDRPLVFAALYDCWKNSEGEVQFTFTILTTSSSSALSWLHDRMPVILGNKLSIDEWLDGSSCSKFDSLLKPYEDPDLVWYPVTSAMGNPSFDGPECIKEIYVRVDQSEPQLKPKNPKEEPGVSEKVCDEAKTNVSTLTSVGPNNSHLKRGYAEFSSVINPSVDEGDKQCTSPAKKKGNVKGSGDKQNTPVSYFNDATQSCEPEFLRDVRISPGVASDIMKNVIPPHRIAEAELKSPSELFDRAFCSMVKSDIAFNILRHRVRVEQEALKKECIDLKARLHVDGETLGTLRRELAKENEISGRLKEEVRVLKVKCNESTMFLSKLQEEKSSLAASVRARDDETRGLKCKVSERDAEIMQLRADLDSKRGQLEVERQSASSLSVRVRTLETAVDSASQSRRDLLAAFPSLFNRALSHPDVMGALTDFIRACHANGKHVASKAFLDSHPNVTADSLPFLKPQTYDDMVRTSAIFDARAFPILARVVEDLDLSISDIFAIFPPES